MNKTILALSAALIFSGAANADVFLKQTETGPTAPEPTARTLWIGKNAVRMESAAVTTIIRLDDKVIYTLVPTEKKAIKTPLDMAAKMLAGMGGMTLTVTPTGETKKIGKWNTRKFIQKMSSPLGGSESEVWATEDIDMDKAALTRLNQALFLSTPAGSAASGSALKAEMAKMKGVPVYAKTTYAMGGNKQVSEVRLVDVGDKPAPANAYQPPPDYQLVGLTGRPLSAPPAWAKTAAAPAATAAASPGRSANAKVGAKVRQLTGFPQTKQAGPATHVIRSIQVTPVIPAAWTIERFKSIAKPKPAPEGKVWYVVKGSSTNHSDKRKSISVTSIYLEDSAGLKYNASPKTSLYQPQGSMLTYRSIEPGATSDWVAYFPVNADARGLRLKANDMQFVGKAFAVFDLPNDGASIVSVAAAASVAPVSAKVATSAPKKTAAVEKTAPATSKPAPAAKTAKAAPAIQTAVPLSRVADKSVGGSLLLPTGSKTMREMAEQHDWWYQPKGSAIGYSTTLTAVWPAKDMAQAVKVATMTGGKELVGKKAIKNGFIVLKKPRGITQELWVFQNDKGKKLAAKCNGPAKELKTLMAICGSLRVE